VINSIKQLGPWFAAVALIFFLIGKYQATVTVSRDYESKYAEAVQKSETSIKLKYDQQISAITESMRVDYESKIARITNTSKKTVIAKDGTTTITEKTKIKENTEVKDTAISIFTRTDEKTTQVSQTDTKIDNKEVNKETKEITKITPASLFKLYSSVTIDDEKDLTFGSGLMYDLYFANVGILGTYTPNTTRKAVGLTFGFNL